MATMQRKNLCVSELIKTESATAVRSWGFIKEAVYVRPLPTTLADLKNRITTAVNSVKQDILLWVSVGFSYRLDVILAAGDGNIEHL
jgi:hypothetical protein